MPGHGVDKDKVQALKASRRILKGKLTRFVNFIDNFDPLSSVEELQERIDKIDITFSEFDALQNELEVIDSLANLQENEDERRSFETHFYNSVGKAKAIINKEMSKQAALNQVSTGLPPQAQQSIPQSSKINLPPINLPTFNGSVENWTEFCDAFKSIVHNDQSIPDHRKFQYLKTSLRGPAADIIQNFKITDENYDICWNLLLKRFENKRNIVNRHLKCLFEMSSIVKESKLELRSILDELQRHMKSLENLGQPTDTWDALVIYLVTTKLDFLTKKEWEQHVTNTTSNTSEFPTYEQLISFLTKKCQLLETLDNSNSSHSNKLIPVKKFDGNKKPFKNFESYSHLSSNAHQRVTVCYYCKNNHLIYSCKEFLKLIPKDRESEIRELKLCINCFKSGHNANHCPSGTCKLCDKKHNTLLHQDCSVQPSQSQGQIRENKADLASQIALQATNEIQNVLSGHCLENKNSELQRQTLLSTAFIYLNDFKGQQIRCRVILDTGSMSNFITSSLCKKLGLCIEHSYTPVAGVSGFSINIRGKLSATVSSPQSNFQTNLEFLVVDKITAKVPCMSFSIFDLNLPKNIVLADPSCHIPSDIDALLGADIFYQLIGNNKIELGENLPILCETKLGYVLSGSLIINNTKDFGSFCHLSVNSEIQTQLERFWRLEECQHIKVLSVKEQEVEEHFSQNTSRDISGRFVVKLPLKDNYQQLGNSYDMALKRFYGLERKLNKDTELKRLYCEFMNEYSDLGHMSLVPKSEFQTEKICYYMPHHGVLKTSSITTKLRTVFDASAITSTGLSLNDVLKIGPTIQDDLFSILIRFRKHNYVITTDVAKMYRQVLVHDSQRDLQRIIWRSDPSHDLKIFRLNTVTYGQACSSFLAIRCLYQVGLDCEAQYPEAAKAIKRDFYCDDLLTGSDTFENTIKLRDKVSELLDSARFPLRKWASNNKDILHNIQAASDISHLVINDNKELKTLGISWDTNQDSLGFTIDFSVSDSNNISKRSILSLISRLFDPLGLAGPVLIEAKLMLQEIWKLNLDWDQNVPETTKNSFIQFRTELKYLTNIRVPRQALLKNYIKLELHGFCDSSLKAYGACLFLRSLDSHGNCNVTLLCAKARISPLKIQTLPRLELLGSLILSRLTDKTVRALDINISDIYFWTDSTIVLAWLHSEPSNWKCFVANRVAEIQRLTDIAQWRHVPSQENPADVISRGATPCALLNNKLWWEGPQWLSLSSDNWPILKPLESNNVLELPERRSTELSSLAVLNDLNIFDKFSDLPKLQRVFAYVLRFIQNCLSKRRSTTRLIGNLSIEEYKDSLRKLTKLAQASMFSQDIEHLKRYNRVHRSSKILNLNPFLDEMGLLHVGGRIKYSEISYDHKYPLLLADKHPFSKLIIKNEHLRHFHSGAQATLAAIRCRFWLTNGRNAVRKYIQGCVTCFRANPTPNVINQMSNLPDFRVKVARPFLRSGLDFAGPFFIKNSKHRNRQFIKAYLCVFVCLVTRAVHFEICSDLSSETFLAALKRFVSRRGICQSLFSDNGTNFIGAKRELREMYQSYRALHKDDNVSVFLRENNISWSLIPPRTPHFGGMWESAVKSAKHHLKRVAANANLTFELFYTLVVEIEAILNSRPLTPLSSDSTDLQVLTPAHFLIGDSLRTPPEDDYTNVPMNRLSHYQMVQKMFQSFWKRWKNEYLATLQTRSKWHLSNSRSIKPGTMVVLKEDNVLPLQWPIGRIVEVFPGNDNIVRVVDIKTKSGVLRRPTTKLCVLPILDNSVD